MQRDNETIEKNKNCKLFLDFRIKVLFGFFFHNIIIDLIDLPQVLPRQTLWQHHGTHFSSNSHKLLLVSNSEAWLPLSRIRSGSSRFRHNYILTWNLFGIQNPFLDFSFFLVFS